MRSHVTSGVRGYRQVVFVFQYRKRYEITCDKKALHGEIVHYKFQYRKRYEITCDACDSPTVGAFIAPFQYRKRYEITCDVLDQYF